VKAARVDFAESPRNVVYGGYRVILRLQERLKLIAKIGARRD
jgi:hypothetical protein